jgi:pimeloyl-ACP methyl ester carboxylesterase
VDTLVFVGHGGLRLAADAFGPPGAAPVLLLPGGGQTRHSWRRVAEAIAAAGHRAISLDLRGHGESGWADAGGYAADAFVGDVVEVAAAMPTPPVIVGASLGGLSAAVAAGENPGMPLRALVLVDIVPHARADGIAKIRAFMGAGNAGFDSPEQAAANVTAYLPHRPPRTVESLASNLRQGGDGRWYWHWDPRFNGEAQERQGSGFAARMAAALPNITAPTLLVTGLRSEIVDEAGVGRFRALLPGAEVVGVRDATHMVAGDANTPFTAAILSFIARLPR